MNNKITIEAGFEIVGERNKFTVGGEFKINLNDKPPVEIEFGTQSFGKTGKINKQIGNLLIAVKNATVTAYKNGVIYDSTVTNVDGEYTLYLEDGIYDIKVQSPAYSRTLKNQTIENGIKLYKKTINDGQIIRKNFDVIEIANFNSNLPIDENIRLIRGTLINVNGSPIRDAEIIVANNETHSIESFVRTDISGKYEFVVSNSKLDLIVRSPIFHAKVLRGFEFDIQNNKGFVQTIIENSLPLEQGGDPIWISY